MRRLIRLGALAGRLGTFGSIVGATLTDYAATSTRTLTFPTGVASGDQLLVVIAQFGANEQFGTWTAPAGWTALAHTAVGETQLLAWTSPYASGLGLDWSVAGASGSIQGGLVAVRGGDFGTPLITSELTGVFTFGLRGGSPQFAVVQNWDGLTNPAEPAGWTDLVTPGGIMAIGSLPAGSTSLTWPSFNAGSADPAQALAFSGS
jgi:hypothetical protein